MDGEVLGFDPELDFGDIIGDDTRRYGFAIADWQAAARPERGDRVRFAVQADRATRIELVRSAHAPPLTLSQAIGAVYATAFGRGDLDFFGTAATRARDYLMPILIILLFGTVQIFLRGSIPTGGLYRLPLWVQLVVFIFVAVGFLFMIAVATGIVALLGWAMGRRGRTRTGVVAFLWVEAALMQPAVCVLRLILSPRDPGFVLLLLGAGLIAAFVGAGRVVKSGFQLSHAALGMLIVLAASLVDFALDRLVG